MENLGNVIISPDVIKSIVVESLKENKEVIGITRGDNNSTIQNFFKSQEKKALEVEIGETECVIDISISIVYGANIQTVAKEVQKLIHDKVEELSGITVKEVNVTVVKVEKIDKDVTVLEREEDDIQNN